jgi:nitronate monooxygenase
VGAPLFLISNPDLVVACCKAGIVGTFPSFNQRTSAGYEQWLKQIRLRLSDDASPFGVQFAVHRTNERWQEDLALTVKYQVPLLITSIGVNREATDAIHSYGGLVFHDAINLRHAKKALEANVDGIIAVCQGAGGHAGSYNPFAFMAELRPLMQDKALLLSGCIGDGYAVAAAIAAGADMAYVGTRLVSTAESGATPANKQMVIDSDITSVVYTDEVDGIGGNWLKQTIPEKSFRRESNEGFNVTAEMGDPKRWKDIWSAGQGVGSILDIPTTSHLIGRFETEFAAATKRLNGFSGSRI